MLQITNRKSLVIFRNPAWGPPQFQEKRSRSEKAILGALGEFRGILGATLGIRNSILGIRNSILGMASHDLSNTKTTILGATPGAIPGIDGNHMKDFHLSILGAFFQELGWSPRARDFKLRNPKSQKFPPNRSRAAQMIEIAVSNRVICDLNLCSNRHSNRNAVGGAEMTIILSDNNSWFLTAP